MSVLLAVVDDLWLFVRESLSGSVTSEPTTPHEEVPVTTVQEVFKDVLDTHVRTEVPVVSQTQTNAELHTGEQYYVGGADAYVYADPVIAFDNALQLLEYGQAVRVLTLKGRWAQVRFGDDIGWVLKDVLRAALAEVSPQFEQGQLYTHDHAETKKLRAYIEDAFSAGRGQFDLTAEEYVYYKLRTKKRQIAWNGMRSRIAGTWQRKLKGVSGVYIRITPKTDAVMEYIIDDVGYLAFVESVFPDNSIRLSEIGAHDTPTFTQYTLTVEQWRELRPVFITIT